MHIRNALGGPLISVFDLVSGFNSNFSFTLSFSFQKNVMKTLSTGKNSWRDLQVPKVQVTREVRGHAPWKNFEIWAS